jgi:signal transduction histidine kinase
LLIPKISDLHLLPGFDELYMDFDPEKIQAIFSNLVGNAVKFTPPGGNIYIKIEKNTSKELGEFLEIKVKDTGKGIPLSIYPTFLIVFIRWTIHQPGQMREPGLAWHSPKSWCN